MIAVSVFQELRFAKSSILTPAQSMQPRPSTTPRRRRAPAVAEAKAAADRLKRLGKPFLNWTGKAERLSFDVPTLPLFVHERLSTKAIIETLKAHEKVAPQSDMFDLFGDPKRPVIDQVLHAYEYKDNWVK
jgi:adenine-specific DNA-methyltransferase